MEPALAPTGLNPDLPNAEDVLYGFFRDAYEQLDAIQTAYSTSGYTNIQPTTTGSSFNFNGVPNTLFVWNALFSQSVTMSNTNGSLGQVDLSPILADDNLRGGFQGCGQFDYNNNAQTLLAGPTYFMNLDYFSVDDLTYEYAGKTFSTNYSANAKGGVLGDVLVDYFDGADFYDGGENINGQWDVFVADFSRFRTGGVHWDLLQ